MPMAATNLLPTETGMQIKSTYRNAFTLVELLVAISILTIVTALIIPRLRIVNKDRNIRETARVIGAKFSAARDHAINLGSGGIVIERNLNFVTQTAGNNRVYFAGTRLIEMKASPPYGGDSGDTFVFFLLVDKGDGTYFIRGFIPLPFEHDPANGRPVIRPNDSIRLNNTTATYSVREVLPPTEVRVNFPNSMGTSGTNNYIGDYEFVNDRLLMLPFDLNFEVDNETGTFDIRVPDPFSSFPVPVLSAPMPIALNDVSGPTIGPFPRNNIKDQPFVFDRQPQRIQSSAVNLPAGYFIDLRYSGPYDAIFDPGNPNNGPESLILSSEMDDPDTHTLFGLAIDPMDDPDPNNPLSPSNATAPFNKEIEIHFNGEGAIDRIYYNGLSQPLSQALYLYVDEYDPTEFIAGEPSLPAAQKALANDTSLWVTIGANGGTNIGYNSPPAVPVNVRQMIGEARIISRDRTTASQ